MVVVVPVGRQPDGPAPHGEGGGGHGVVGGGRGGGRGVRGAALGGGPFLVVCGRGGGGRAEHDGGGGARAAVLVAVLQPIRMVKHKFFQSYHLNVPNISRTLPTAPPPGTWRG